MSRPWFKPKTFGIGVTPASWEGWAATAAFCALAVIDRLLAPRLGEALSWTGLAVLAAAFIALSILKGEGAWRWRWGGGD